MRTCIRVFFVTLVICSLSTSAGAVIKLWSAQNNDVNSNSIAVDAEGNTFVKGQPFPLIKYDRYGEMLWVAEPFEEPYDFKLEGAIVLDNQGDVYLIGSSFVFGVTNQDIAVAKFDGSSGSRLWLKQWDGYEEGAGAYAIAITIDAAGDIYVAGQTGGGNHVNPYVVIKYDASDGSELWTAIYDETEYSDRKVEAITVDNAGGVYVTGSSRVSTASPDFYEILTVKFNADDGSFIWMNNYCDSAKCRNYGKAIAVDELGHVIVSGWSEEIHPLYVSYATIQYDASDGTELWVNTYHSSGTAQDYVEDMAIDGVGNVYITGTTEEPEGPEKHYTIKYDVDGAQLWNSLYSEPASTFSQIEGEGWNLVLDRAGDVYVGGPSHEFESKQWDYLTMKYDAATGAEVWKIPFDGFAQENDFAKALAIDDHGNIYVTGSSEDGNDASSAITICYSQCEGCLIFDTCYEDGAINQGNTCLVCDAETNNREWTNREDGATCDDGEFCNGADSCLGGYCTGHAGNPCPDDEVWCNGEEFCDEIGEACIRVNVPCCPDYESCDEDADICEPLGDDDDDDDDNDDDSGIVDDDDDDSDLKNTSSDSGNNDSCG